MGFPFADPQNPYGNPYQQTAGYQDPALEGKVIHDRSEPEKGPLSGNAEEMGFPSSGDGQTTNATPPGMLGGIGQGGPSWRGLRTGPPISPQMGQQPPQGRMGGPSPQNGHFAGAAARYGQLGQGMGGDGAQAMPQGQFGPPPVNPDPWKKQQVAEAESAMDQVRQRQDLNPVQKNHALQKLNLKLNRLDPMRQYRRESPANSMTQIERYVAQNVHMFPEHGVALAVDGMGKPHWHTLPQQQDRAALETAKFQHQQQLDLAKHQHQTSLKEMQQSHSQALAEQAQKHAQMLAEMKQTHADQMADVKRGHSEQDQFLAFHKHLSDLRAKENAAISSENQKMVEKGTTDKMRDNLPEIDMDEAWSKYQKLRAKTNPPPASMAPFYGYGKSAAQAKPDGWTDEEWAKRQRGEEP